MPESKNYKSSYNKAIKDLMKGLENKKTKGSIITSDPELINKLIKHGKNT